VNYTVLFFFGVAGRPADPAGLDQPRGELLVQAGGHGQPEHVHHVRGSARVDAREAGLPIRRTRTAKNLSSDASPGCWKPVARRELT
jgi:hypothetical protein